VKYGCICNHGELHIESTLYEQLHHRDAITLSLSEAFGVSSLGVTWGLVTPSQLVELSALSCTTAELKDCLRA
jgi:hypothetical protein